MFPIAHIQSTWSATQPRVTFITSEAENIRLADAIGQQPAFSETLTRLIDLLNDAGEDDYGECGPSQRAFKLALTLIREAETIVRVTVPGSVSTDSAGGIRVTWRQNDRELRLVCPGNADIPIYLYREAPDGHSSINEEITAGVLANNLRWLAQSRAQAARG